MYFHYFVIISPWKRAGPFIWTNLNPLHPRMLCAKFGWNWLSGSGEEDFLILSMFFPYFCNYLPLEKGGALHLNKLESPSPKDALCQVWLNLAQWFWRRRWKCEKFTDRRTDRQTTDDRWSEKLTWAFSSGELKTEEKNSFWLASLKELQLSIQSLLLIFSGATDSRTLDYM